MYFVMKMIWPILFMHQIKKLKIVSIYYWRQIKISCIMFISKILIDFCSIRQKVNSKNAFVNVAYNVLVVKEPCRT